MDLFIADDARQNTPSRPGMGPLVAAGGLYVPSEQVSVLERFLDSLCKDCGFPNGQEFKWSPGRDLWMRTGLVGDARKQFFIKAVSFARQCGAKGCVVIEDKNHSKATSCESHEADVTRLLIERANGLFSSARDGGIF